MPHLHRDLRTLKKEHTRITNRIQGLLANQGIRLAKVRDLGAVLEGMQLWDGSPFTGRLAAQTPACVRARGIPARADRRVGT